MWHLLSSGRGYRIFRGKFGEAVSASQSLQGEASSELSPVDRLELGDIIAYEIKGEIHHVAVVVGKITRVCYNSQPLLTGCISVGPGWSENTVFWFIKITY